jgi:hypothetical protein
MSKNALSLRSTRSENSTGCSPPQHAQQVFCADQILRALTKIMVTRCSLQEYSIRVQDSSIRGFVSQNECHVRFWVLNIFNDSSCFRHGSIRFDNFIFFQKAFCNLDVNYKNNQKQDNSLETNLASIQDNNILCTTDAGLVHTITFCSRIRVVDTCLIIFHSHSSQYSGRC